MHGFGYAFDAEAQEEGKASSRFVGRLVWDEGDAPLVEGANVIGRGEEADVRIDVAGISRRHAQIVAHDGRFALEDLGSKNGTFVGARRLEGPAPLSDGDEFRLGRTTVVVLRTRAGSTVTEG